MLLSCCIACLIAPAYARTLNTQIWTGQINPIYDPEGLKCDLLTVEGQRVLLKNRDEAFQINIPITSYIEENVLGIVLVTVNEPEWLSVVPSTSQLTLTEGTENGFTLTVERISPAEEPGEIELVINNPADRALRSENDIEPEETPEPEPGDQEPETGEPEPETGEPESESGEQESESGEPESESGEQESESGEPVSTTGPVEITQRPEETETVTATETVTEAATTAPAAEPEQVPTELSFTVSFVSEAGTLSATFTMATSDYDITPQDEYTGVLNGAVTDGTKWYGKDIPVYITLSAAALIKYNYVPGVSDGEFPEGTKYSTDSGTTVLYDGGYIITDDAGVVSIDFSGTETEGVIVLNTGSSEWTLEDEDLPEWSDQLTLVLTGTEKTILTTYAMEDTAPVITVEYLTEDENGEEVWETTYLVICTENNDTGEAVINSYEAPAGTYRVLFEWEYRGRLLYTMERSFFVIYGNGWQGGISR